MKHIPKNIIVIFIFFFATNILSGQKTKMDSITPDGYKLKLEYNVMNDITLENPARYGNSKRYKFIENGIYLDLREQGVFKYRMTISYTQGTGKINYQYPLEDLLDKYLLYVSHEFRTIKNKFTIELGGDLDDMIKAKNEIIGKKVFNREYLGEDKKIYVDLIIE